MSIDLLPFSRAALHRATIRHAPPITDLLDNLPWFAAYPAGWSAWRAFLCALYGLPMSGQEYDIFKRCTGRVTPPTRKAREGWLPTGRRARKSAIAALVGVYEGAYRDHGQYLAPGERARIPVLANDKDDATTIFNFSKAILAEPPMQHLLQKEPVAETIELSTGCDLHIKAFGLTAGRSKAVPCALLDEVAFWQTDKESKITDEEVIKGIRFAMANTPDPLLLGLSSPYAESGILYEKYERYHGEKNARAADEDRVLVWKADTLTMHNSPAIQVFVAEEYRKDPIAADAEVGANFRKDVQDYISRAMVRSLTVEGRDELAPCKMGPIRPGEDPGPRYRYWAFVDPSGGSADSFTLAVAHWDPDAKRNGWSPDKPTEKLGKAVLDLVWEKTSPLKPGATVEEMAPIIKRYGLSAVTGDAYAGEWPRERFGENGLGYMVAGRDKHDIYKDILPALNSGEVELLDTSAPGRPDLAGQLVALKRRVSPNGKEIIDHPPKGHDDVINAAAGALLDAYNYGQFQVEPAPDRVYATTQEIVAHQVEELENEISRRGEEDRAGEDQWMSRWQQ